jgi:hypothetical protein
MFLEVYFGSGAVAEIGNGFSIPGSVIHPLPLPPPSEAAS